MTQTISVTAPISSLLGDLQDISTVLATTMAADFPVIDGDESQGFQLEAWNHIKRVTAMSQGNICGITQPELDRLIIGYTRCGLLITHYQASIGATIYRRPDGSVLAMSIGGHHFCHRDIRPIRSVTLAAQQRVGRANRVQWTDDAFPLLSKEGGAGEGASAMTSAMLAKYFGVPLNIGGPINTALFTEGLDAPDAAQ